MERSTEETYYCALPPIFSTRKNIISKTMLGKGHFHIHILSLSLSLSLSQVSLMIYAQQYRISINCTLLSLSLKWHICTAISFSRWYSFMSYSLIIKRGTRNPWISPNQSNRLWLRKIPLPPQNGHFKPHFMKMTFPHYAIGKKNNNNEYRKASLIFFLLKEFQSCSSSLLLFIFRLGHQLVYSIDRNWTQDFLFNHKIFYQLN